MKYLRWLCFLSFWLVQNVLAIPSQTSQYLDWPAYAVSSLTGNIELLQVCEVKINIDSGIGGTGNTTRTGGIGGTGHTPNVPDVTNIPEIPDVPVDSIPDTNIPEITNIPDVPADMAPAVNIPDIDIPASNIGDGVDVSVPGQ